MHSCWLGLSCFGDYHCVYNRTEAHQKLRQQSYAPSAPNRHRRIFTNSQSNASRAKQHIARKAIAASTFFRVGNSQCKPKNGRKRLWPSWNKTLSVSVLPVRQAKKCARRTAGDLLGQRGKLLPLFHGTPI